MGRQVKNKGRAKKTSSGRLNFGKTNPPGPVEVSPEWFSVGNGGRTIVRNVRLRNGRSRTTIISVGKRLSKSAAQDQLSSIVDLSFLKRAKKSAAAGKGRPVVRTADLFSSCGFMSLGVSEACRALGKRFMPALAVELNAPALDVYKLNFSPIRAELDDISKCLDGRLGTKRTAKERRLLRGLGRIDLLLGGPPCQGHSDLNNHTRRSDPKNKLYNRMARFAELARPKHIVIENVPAAVHDKSRIVQKTIAWLEALGYHVDSALVQVARIGVPQGRRRHVVVASLTRKLVIEETIDRYATAPRPTRWALEDLLDIDSEALLDTASTPTAENEKRIAYLFKHRVFNLPDSMRPECHRNGGHTYKSVYGRLRWDKPSQTITTGFTSMGQGRFVHPRRQRTLTPHEAARLQFIPDFFQFNTVKARTALAGMIGNAVPPKLTYVLALELLR